MRYLRKLMLRWRLWKVYNSLPENTNKVGFYLLYRLCSVTDYYLLQQYNRTIGKTIVLHTNFKHAEESLTWLDTLIRIITNLEYIENNITYVFLNGEDRTLDSFLVNRYNATVNIMSYSEALEERIEALRKAYSAVTEPKYVKYYARNLTRLLSPILVIQESLLNAAKQT